MTETLPVIPDEAQRDAIEVPESYYECLHIKAFWKASLPGLLIVGLGLMKFIIPVGSLGIDTPDLVAVLLPALGPLTIVAGVFAIYREYWRWQNWPVTCDATDGRVLTHQADNRWLVIRGSSPDAYSVDEYTLFTPDRTWWELYLFRSSQTLHLLDNGEVVKEIKDLKYVEKLLAIQKYRESEQIRTNAEIMSMDDRLAEQIVLMYDQTSVSRAILASLHRIETLLGGSPPKLEDTSEL